MEIQPSFALAEAAAPLAPFRISTGAQYQPDPKGGEYRG
jgi:hypothetical protein